MTYAPKRRSPEKSRPDPKPKENRKQSPEMLTPGLYVVATPIGNLGDLTARAKAFLGSVDLIAAEDTRVTAKLLTLIGLKRPLISYNDNNDGTRRAEILGRLAAGATIALVCDAGTPVISDPGFRLIQAAAEA